MSSSASRSRTLAGSLTAAAPAKPPSFLASCSSDICRRYARDPVPNLRLELADALARAAPHLRAHAVRTRVLPALGALGEDEDLDVAFAAREAVETCAAIVGYE